MADVRSRPLLAHPILIFGPAGVPHPLRFMGDTLEDTVDALEDLVDALEHLGVASCYSGVCLAREESQTATPEFVRRRSELYVVAGLAHALMDWLHVPTDGLHFSTVRAHIVTSRPRAGASLAHGDPAVRHALVSRAQQVGEAARAGMAAWHDVRAHGHLMAGATHVESWRRHGPVSVRHVHASARRMRIGVTHALARHRHETHRGMHARMAAPPKATAATNYLRTDPQGDTMERLQKRLWATITNAQLILDRIQPEGPQFTASRKRLDAHEREIREAYYAQGSAAMRLGTDGGAIRALRVSLRQEQLIQVRRFGIKALRWVPGIERALQVPPARANSEDLVAAAGRMVSALRAKRRQHAFVEAGFKKDFLDLLGASAAALEERSKHHDTIKRARAAATARLRRALKDARQELMVMDGLLRGPMMRDESLASTWKKAKRMWGKVGRPPKKRGT